MLRSLRRALLRIGYRLPTWVQLPFARFLLDSDQPSSSGANDSDQAIVRFEFVGGCRDGEIVEGLLANPFYWASDHGTVGNTFAVASDYAVDLILAGEPTGPVLKHEYRVAEKCTVAGVTHVRAVAVSAGA